MNAIIDSTAPYSLERMLEGFSDSELRLIFSNIGAIEIMFGCSSGCPDCGVHAKKGATNPLSFDQLTWLFSTFSDELATANPLLHHGNDPLDWKDGTKTYRDVHHLYTELIGINPFVSTYVPPSSEELVLDMLLAGEINRVSITPTNFYRLKRLFYEKFPEVIDKKFITEKKSDGSYNITFTKEPNVHGEDNWIELLLSITKESQAQGYIFTRDGKTTSNERLKLGPKNIDDLSLFGIGSFHGVIMRYTGLFNTQITQPTPRYNQGIIYEPLTPKTPNVWDIWWNPDHFPAILPKNYEEMTSIRPDKEVISPFLAKDTLNTQYKSKAQEVLSLLGYFLAHIEANNSESVMVADMFSKLYYDDYMNGFDSPPENDPYYNRIQHYKEVIEQKRTEARERFWKRVERRASDYG